MSRIKQLFDGRTNLWLEAAQQQIGSHIMFLRTCVKLWPVLIPFHIHQNKAKWQQQKRCLWQDISALVNSQTKQHKAPQVSDIGLKRCNLWSSHSHSFVAKSIDHTCYSNMQNSDFGGKRLEGVGGAQERKRARQRVQSLLQGPQLCSDM